MILGDSFEVYHGFGLLRIKAMSRDLPDVFDAVPLRI